MAGNEQQSAAPTAVGRGIEQLRPVCVPTTVFRFLPEAAKAAAVKIKILVHGFYRSGALVFGSDPVVLPLLEDAIVFHGGATQQSCLTFQARVAAQERTAGPPGRLKALSLKT